MIVDPENWYLNKAESSNNPPTSPPPPFFQDPGVSRGIYLFYSYLLTLWKALKAFYSGLQSQKAATAHLSKQILPFDFVRLYR